MKYYIARCAEFIGSNIAVVHLFEKTHYSIYEGGYPYLNLFLDVQTKINIFDFDLLETV